MIKSWRSAGLLLSIILAGMLNGCEGITTGAEIARLPLQAADGGPPGAYAPVKLTLDPSMNPVAFNFRADFTQNPAEFGKWNSYRATLTQGGAVVATRTFNVNHPTGGGPDANAAPPTSTVHTLFYVDVQTAGEHELTITPAAPPAITLNNATADARRNVQRSPR